MKKTFTKLLLLGVLCLIGGNAWGTDLTTMVGQVGASDNSSNAFADHSKNVVIKDGETYVYHLTNYNGGGNYYNNWIFEAYNSENQYIDFRADGGHWGEAGVRAFSGSNNESVANWMTEYNGATATITVVYNGGTLTITNNSILSGGAEYNNTLTTTGLSGDLTMRFTNEKSHQIIDKVVYINAAGIETGYVLASPTADTYLDYANRTSNYGTSEILRCGAWLDQFSSASPGLKTNSSSNYKDQIAVLKFDVSEYTGNISSATLNLTGQGEEAGYGASFMLMSCNNTSWEENVITADNSAFNLRATSGRTIDKLNASQSAAANATNVAMAFSSDELNGFVNNDEDGIVSFAIAVIGSRSGKIYSNEYEIQNYRPSLMFSYIIAPTYTATFTEDNSLAPTVKIYSNSGRTVEVANGSLLDGTTYYYRATLAGYKDYDGQFTVAGANPSVNFTMVAKLNCNYTIKASTGATLAIGTALEDENATIAVPRYINVNGTLYETPKGSSDWYHKTYTISQNNQVETVTYNATSYTNIVFYSEGEALAGATSGNGNSSRTSMGLTGYGTNLPVTRLAAGSYKIYMHGANGNNDARAVAFKNGEVAVVEFSIAAKGNDQDFTSPEFTLTEAADITLTSAGSQASGVDYFFIQQTAASVTVPANTGMTTFCSPYTLDFTEAENIKAYEGRVVGSKVTLSPINVVPAGTGVLLVAEGGATENIPVTTETPVIIPGNQFIGALTETIVIAEATATNYVLAYDGTSAETIANTIGFYNIGATSATVPAGKAYLKVANVPVVGINARLSIEFGDGELTGIDANDAEEAEETEGEAINLSGLPVNASFKGIMIKNGQKIYNK